MTAKMNRDVFNLLRQRIDAKLPVPHRINFRDAERLWVKYARKEVKKIPKQFLVEIALGEKKVLDFVEKRPSDFADVPDTNAKLRKQLFDAVDNAELLFLAGDNSAVLALIQKLDTL